MARLLRKAERKIERAFVTEILEMLGEMLNGTEEMNEEEKEIRRQQIIKMLEAKCKEVEGQLEALTKGTGGTVWDFSKERTLDIFTEDDVIFLRNCRDYEKEAYIRIKKENTNNPEFYNDQTVAESMWKMLNVEKSFCCSVIRKSDNEFIGYISLKDTEANLWEMAIELLQEHCHKGYGSRAVTLFLPAISKLTGKKQFQALVETDNIPSQRLMESLGARLIDIYDYTFHGDEEAATAFEEENLSEITGRMVELAKQLEVEPRKMLSHVLDYRFFVEGDKIVDRARKNDTF